MTRAHSTPSASQARRCAVLLGLLIAPLSASAEEILVASAVSLREVATEIGKRYAEETPGERATFTFGASSVLALQLRAGAPVDVFLSADEVIVDRLEAQGLVAGDSRFTLATNRLVVMAAADLGFEIRRAEDLSRPEVRRIALPQHAVPVGRYARQWLERRGLLAAIEPRAVQTEHARATLAAVDAGNADVAIVYATDARLARSARVVLAVPDAEQPRIVYTAALVRGSPRSRSARVFLAYLGSAAAQSILAKAGFAAASRARADPEP